MTYEEYIKNPAGKGSAAFGSRKVQLQDFNDRWAKLRLREQKPPVHYLYKSKNDEEYIAHFKIPSETVAKFYYDVIVRFFPPRENGNVRQHTDLSGYNVQFFSNDPSFVYTYEHAFYVNKLFFVDLINKTSPIFIKEKAVEKNPRDDIGYVKSLCFMYFDLKDLKLFNKASWARATRYDRAVWRGTVEETISKIRSRQEAGKSPEKKATEARMKTSVKKSSPIDKLRNMFAVPEGKGFANINNSVFKSVNFTPGNKKRTK